jgi:hypothetical protein
MELQFVGDIKAVRVGDKFRASGKLQSRRTGNFIEVRTEVDIPMALAEAKQVYEAARQWLAKRGKELPALPESESESTDLLGKKRSAAGQLQKALQRQAQGKSLKPAQLALIQEHQRAVAARKQGREQQGVAQRALTDEKKKALVQATMRTEAGRRLSERRVERKGYEDQLVGLKKQIEDAAGNDQRQAELQAQASQYEARLAQLDDSMAAMQSQYETQLANVAAMPAESVTQLPGAQTVLESAGVADDELSGLGWGFKDLLRGFKKAFAVVVRSKIVKGLVKAAAMTVAGPAGSAAANAVYDRGKQTQISVVPVTDGGAITGIGAGQWLVPGLNISARNAQTWMRLLRSAQAGHPRALALKNRIVLMARMGQPSATRTFWLLRGIERLLPEVRARLEQAAEQQIDPDVAEAEGEPQSVASASLVGFGDSTGPVQVKFMMLDPDTREMYQVPFGFALGKKKPVRSRRKYQFKKQRDAKQAAAAAAAPTQPGYDPNAQPQPGYEQYAQPQPQPGYEQYAQPQYAPDPYGQQQYAQPQYAQPQQQYASQQQYGPQSYGDYSQAEASPAFDPYNPASYGY